MKKKFLLVAVAAAVVVGLMGLISAAAQATPSATRSFDPAQVAPGGRVVVTISAADYGRIGGVVETLPAGFVYVGSDLAGGAIDNLDGTVQFRLLGAPQTFTYTVTASSTEGDHTFAGVLRGENRQDTVVGGPTVVTVKASGGTTPTPDAGSGVDAIPGQTVTVTFDTGSQDRYRINTDSEGSATFASNGGQALRCADNVVTCDVNTATGKIGLRVAVDEDSPIGEIYVQRITRDPQGKVTVAQEVVVTVNAPNPPAALKAHGAPPPSTSLPANGNTSTTIGAQLVNALGKGIAGQPIQVTTTRGVLTSLDVSGTTTCQALSACTLTTQSDGSVSVQLRGNGATGEAKVAMKHLASGFSRTATVVLHGPAASISAAVAEGTIGVGGSTFIIVTIVDADGNPAVGAQADVTSNKPGVPAVTGPKVPAGSTAVLLDHSLVVDRQAPGHPAYLPSCGVRAAVAADTTATPPVAAVPGSDGTNTAGKCVIQVTAAGGDTPSPADDSTRGTHTLTVGTSDARIPTMNVEVQVGGAPANIDTSAAPARVDSLSSNSITVTVLDDEGVRVGAVPISVVKVEGDGNVDDVPGGMTSDGRGTFKFLAPLSSGEVVFLIRAGDATKGQQIETPLTVAIGPEPVEAPEAPPATWSVELTAGTHNVVWNGEDGADTSAGAADGVTAIWQWNGSGWDGYFPDAADVPGGNTLESLSNGAAYWVIVE